MRANLRKRVSEPDSYLLGEWQTRYRHVCTHSVRAHTSGLTVRFRCTGELCRGSQFVSSVGVRVFQNGQWFGLLENKLGISTILCYIYFEF